MIGERLRITAVAGSSTARWQVVQRSTRLRSGRRICRIWTGDLFGQRPLLRRRGAANFLLDKFSLVILPLAVLVAVVTQNDQNADQNAEHREPAVEFAERQVVHVSGPP